MTMPTLHLFHRAELRALDAEEPVRSPELLRRCHGKTSDATGIRFTASFEGLPVSKDADIVARIVQDASSSELASTSELAVVIAFPLDRVPSEDERDLIVRRTYAAMFSGWGLNADFDLGDELADYVLSFEPASYRVELV